MEAAIVAAKMESNSAIAGIIARFKLAFRV